MLVVWAIKWRPAGRGSAEEAEAQRRWWPRRRTSAVDRRILLSCRMCEWVRLHRYATGITPTRLVWPMVVIRWILPSFRPAFGFRETTERTVVTCGTATIKVIILYVFLLFLDLIFFKLRYSLRLLFESLKSIGKRITEIWNVKCGIFSHIDCMQNHIFFYLGN